MRLEAHKNKQALQVSLKRIVVCEVKSKGDVKEISRHNNTIKSLKEKAEKLRLDAAKNKQSMATSLNRTVVAERNNKPLVQQLHLATKQSIAHNNNTEHYETKLKSLTKEHRNCKQFNLKLQTTNDELYMTIDMLIESSPISILQKENTNKKGGQKTIPTYIWTLILEQQVNNTPPASINSNILSVLKVFSPKTQVRDLPHVNTIRKGRTVLGVVCHTLAAYRLAQSKHWKQLHTDGTSRRQSAITNLVINIQDEEGESVPILLTTNIIPEDESSETARDSIIQAVK